MTTERMLEAKANLIGLMEGLLTLNKRLISAGLMNSLIQSEINELWENNEYRTIIEEEEKEKLQTAWKKIQAEEGTENGNG
jgi:hypothetical protein